MNQMNNNIQAQRELVNGIMTQKWIDVKISSVMTDCQVDHDRAEDAVMQSIVDLLEKIDTGEIINDIDGFVFCAAKRRAFKNLRNDHVNQMVTDDTLVGMADFGDPGQMFWLGEAQGEILREIINEDQSYEDVAKSMGLNHHEPIRRIVNRWIND